MERKGLVTFKGNPMTLVGNEVKVGDAAPNFTATSLELKPVSLNDFKDSVVIISAVPSLDTPVCEIQTMRFNQEAPQLDARVVTISLDLPFAQKRFKSDHGLDKVEVLSDYKDREFANAYGLYVKELGLLSRAVLVIGKDGKIHYLEIVRELSEQPDYPRALEAARKLLA